MSKFTKQVALYAFLLGSVATDGLQAQWSQGSLSLPRGGLCAVSVDGRAFFAGGGVGLTTFDRIDIYDEASGVWSESALPSSRIGPTAAALGDYAFFAGGIDSFQDTTGVVDILHVPTMQWTAITLSVPRTGMGATTVGNKVIFAGGLVGNIFAPSFSDAVDIYDADLGLPSDPDAWSTATLDFARSQPAATTVGHLALFAAGANATDYTALVDIYDDSTGLWSTTSLSAARVIGTQAATTVGTRAYFAGGFNHLETEPIYDVIDIYDTQTGAWTTDTLSEPRLAPATVAIGNTILFAGGNLLSGGTSDLVDIFDAGTGTWSTSELLSEARGSIVRTVVADKVLFAGGKGESGLTAAVDIYEHEVSAPWSGLGFALPGTHGDPILLGSGPLTPGSAGSVALSNAAGPGALAVLFASLASTPTSFRGGTLVPVPFFKALTLSTSGSPGGATLPWASWPAGLSGLSVYLQAGVQDGAALRGVALSNALRADVP